MSKPLATTENPAGSLASSGGKPLRTKAFAPWPVFAEDERRAIAAVLASGRVNYWTGEECGLFEREFAARAGCEYGIALANGTLALELALRTLGVGPGDEVISPAKTFIASASCAVAVGARLVVCDVDPDSQNLTAETVRAAITPRTSMRPASSTLMRRRYARRCEERSASCSFMWVPVLSTHAEACSIRAGDVTRRPGRRHPRAAYIIPQEW